MRVVGLLSGGKDSCYALMQCIAAGHKAVALATLLPAPGIEESNSHMYQSVGVNNVWRIAKAMGSIPIYTRTIEGKSVNTAANYTQPIADDEVEDLYALLKSVKEGVEGGVDGVSVGAILSDYQRVRVENVCVRLGLVCYSYLWQREQKELLSEMLKCDVEAVLIKVAGAGLLPEQHCGQTLQQLHPTLLQLNSKFDLHVCGEGGEFETFTTDCPLYEKRIQIDRNRLVKETGDVGYMVLEQLSFQDKQLHGKSMEERVVAAGVPGPLHFVEEILRLELSEAPAADVVDVATLSEAPVVQSNINKLLRPDQRSSSGPCVVVSAGGWWVASSYAGSCVDEVLRQMTDDLATHGLSLAEACEVRAFVRSLATYAQFNAAYKKHFGHNPPVRACVQSCISSECQLEVLGYSHGEKTDSSPRQVLHVQSVSHWAPANIGPYSQAVKVGSHVSLAGMIGLVGGTLDVIEGGGAKQAALALRHIDRLLCCVFKTSDTPRNLLLQVICYSKSVEASHCSEPGLQGLRCPLLHVVVQRLPKDADIELHCAANALAASYQLSTKQYSLKGWAVSLQCMAIPRAAALIATLDGAEGHPSEPVCVELLLDFLGVAVNEIMTSVSSNSTELLSVTLYFAAARLPGGVADAVAAAVTSANATSSCDGPRLALSAVPVTAIGSHGQSVAAVVINTLTPVVVASA